MSPCWGMRLLAGAGLFFSLMGSARAWDAAETHAGLTEESVSSSKLHRFLSQSLGRGLGLWETLRYPPAVAGTGGGQGLGYRLGTLDSAGGYRPGKEGTQSALAWVVAGAVLEKTPPETARHHFLDAATRKGLQDDPGLSGTMHALSLSFDDDTMARDLATGGAFDLTGMGSLAWLTSPRNELGLPRFWGRLVEAMTARLPAERESALIESLMALGGVLCVLQDAGHPAYGRNDMRGEFLGNADGSGLETFVRDRFGRVALPASTSPMDRPSWESYFWAEDGKGLSQIAGTRFFSKGTLPADTQVQDRTPQRVLADATMNLARPEPSLAGLAIPLKGRSTYLRVDGRRIAKVSRVLDRLHFDLDEKVFEDTSTALLPTVLSFSTGMVNHLLRGELDIQVADGKATVLLKGLEGIKSVAEFVVLFENAEGIRTPAASDTRQITRRESVPIPAGTRKVAAAWVGEDTAGKVVVVREVTLP